MLRKFRLYHLINILFKSINSRLLLIIPILSACNSTSNPIILDTSKPIIEIGLLLPLESENKDTNILSTEMMNAARLAAADLKGVEINLTIYPTSGIAERAIYAAQSAINRGAQIIIGPLYGEETIAIKELAKKHKIKIISFSNNDLVADKNTYIIGVTLASISNRIAEYAISKKLQRIAIVAPEGVVGKKGITTASIAILNNGGKIATVQTYPLSPEGIKKVAPSIFEKIIKTKADAIMFTDTPTRGLIFITTELDRQFTKKKEKKMQILGLSRWDASSKVLKEPSLQGGWFVITDKRFETKYIDRFYNAYGVEPTRFSALSYDAIASVGVIAKQAFKDNLVDPFDSRNITNPIGFLGVNGVFRFKKNGINERALSIVKVQSGNIRVISKAPEEFKEIALKK